MSIKEPIYAHKYTKERDLIKPYLCINRFRHASLRTAYQGGPFALIGYGIHKQLIDYPQQIQMLKERGLIINDEEQALEQLRIIS